jgi:NAD(P)-dependent dehydrogenase (short-subunit alcohol dehydrogenase family)
VNSESTIGRLFRLDGDVAVVTGGAGRLGSQYARALADAGARVAVLDLSPSPGPAVARLLHDRPDDVSFQTADVTRRGQVDAAFDAIRARFGVATILINNAGVASSPADAALETGRFEQYPETAWTAMIDSHLKSTLVMSQSFIATFREATQAGNDRTSLAGSIVNVSSTYGLVSPDQSLYEFKRRSGADYYKPVAYSVAKSGVLNFTRWLAEYCAPFGIRVNTLVPGGVQEAEHDPEFVAEYARRTPLGRMARDDEYNGAVVFLASKASAYMTGAMLVVDGGWTAR